jgi:hypothetical protein
MFKEYFGSTYIVIFFCYHKKIALPDRRNEEEYYKDYTIVIIIKTVICEITEILLI